MVKSLTVSTLLFLCLNMPAKSLTYPELNNMPVLIDGTKLPHVKPFHGNFLYMAETELSNLQYREFLYWLKHNQPDQYDKNYPDTTLLYHIGKAYFTNPAYNDFPLVGVSQIQAKQYCLWLHDRLETYFAGNNIPITAFKVRLPTEPEWEKAARGGLATHTAYPWDYEGVRYQGKVKKHRGKILLNCRMGNLSDENMAPYDGFITTSTYSYWPNPFELYNMCGNVSEWLDEAGKHKGGSWLKPPYNCRIDFPAQHLSPRKGGKDIGFRYVIEIVEIKDEQKISALKLDNKYFSSHFNYVPKDAPQQQMRFMSNEISNLEYKQFLLENPAPEYRVQEQAWDRLMDYGFYKMYGKHSAFNLHPVLAVSYKSALAYCAWLTEKYKQSEKKPYKQVLFRLPTEAEWETAAHAGNTSPYSWHGPFTRNSRGCYLGNYAPFNEKYLFQDSNRHIDWVNPNGVNYNREADGSILPVRIDSYFPNDFGLYNMCGNVAEMVAEEGVSKGGSWVSNQFEIMIASKGKYSEPSADLGFRVLAEVIEP